MVGRPSLSALKTESAVSPFVSAVLFAMLRSQVTAATATQHCTLKAQSGSWLSLCRGYTLFND